MFGNNYDKDNGVSIWGHVLDGAATGAIAGMGVLSLPGAIGGGLMGLANGLWADHQDSVAQEQWMKDIDKLAPGSKEARGLESSVEHNADALLDEYLEGGGDPAKVDSGAMADQAIARSYHQQQADKMNRDGGGSWWDAIF